MRKYYSFTLKLEGNGKRVRANMQRFANENGMDYAGDEENGLFGGRGFIGEYRRVGDLFIVNIHKKPRNMPISKIKKGMREVIYTGRSHFLYPPREVLFKRYDTRLK